MSQKVTPFMGGLGIDATSKFEVQSNATVTVGNGTTTGNVTVGATITTGTLITNILDISTNNPRIRFDDSDTSNNGEITLDNTALRIEADEDDAVAGSKISFRVDASEKALINSSGLDVTGDVGGDTLTVSGDGTISGDVTLGTNSSNTISITGSIDLGTL
jgi:cytoskeletal protein CcmA (bactofilin family)